jgi:hypothetical protein
MPAHPAQIKLLKIKDTVSEVKTLLNRVNGRLDTKEKEISELQDITILTIQIKLLKNSNKDEKSHSHPGK